METIKMGKYGELVLPAAIRKELGLEDGSLLITEAKDGEIRLRPALTSEPETWTPERTAYFMLINSMTKEEWDSMIPDVLELGIDPTKIEGIAPNHRDTLPTGAEWDQRLAEARKTGSPERLSA